MLDPIALKQWVLFGSPFGSVENPSLDHIEKIQYEHDGRSIDEAVADLDSVFEDILLDVRDKYNEDTTYGLGLSGGLDSRLTLHYAKQAGIDPHVYFYGNKQHDWLPIPTYDYLRAKQVGKQYGITDIPAAQFQSKPHLHRLRNDIENGWLIAYNIWRYQIPPEDLPRYEVMLSGLNGGENFGYSIPERIFTMDEKDMTEYLLGQFGSADPIDGVVSADEIDQIYDQIYDFVTDFDSMVDVHQSFFCNLQAKKNDVWESHSLFNHERFEEEREGWDPKWLINERLRFEFFEQIHPDLAEIPDTVGRPPVGRKGSSFWDLWYRGLQNIYGPALTYDGATTNSEFVTTARKIFERDNELFDRYFDTGQIIDYLENEQYSGNGGVVPNLMVVKLAMDMGALTEDGYAHDFYLK